MQAKGSVCYPAMPLVCIVLTTSILKCTGDSIGFIWLKFYSSTVELVKHNMVSSPYINMYVFSKQSFRFTCNLKWHSLSKAFLLDSADCMNWTLVSSPKEMRQRLGIEICQLARWA